MAAYTPTVWINNTAPPLSAANLDKLTNELELQASEIGLSHTLPDWTDNAPPALTDAAPLNEMERVLFEVALSQGLTYTKTVWSSGWTPSRNAARFNRMEQQALLNRNALDATGPTLQWAAPTLVTPITLLVPSTGGYSFPLTPTRDYIITFENNYREGPLAFQGSARNVIMKGLEQVITDTTSTDYGQRRLLEFRDITGVIHIEGYYGHGVTQPSLTEGINITCPLATLQIQNSRIEGVKRMNVNADPQHPDVIQTWSLKTLRLFNFTCSSDYQGFLTMAIGGGVYPGTQGGEVAYHQLNCHVLPNAFSGGLQNVPFIFPLQRAQKFLLGDVYVAGAYLGGQPAGVANAIYERANDPFVGGAPTLWDYQLFRANGTAYQAAQTGKTTATWLGDMLTVNQDDYILFINPSYDNIWNLTQTAGGRVKKGIPAGGDYQPAATTGRNYPG